MATLEKIRGKAGLLVVVIGIALLAFIVGDLFNSGHTFFRMSANKVAVVDGEKITYEQFVKRVEEMTEAMKIQYGSSAVNGEMTAQINQNALDGLVAELLLNEAAAQVGMTVPQEEMADLLQGEQVSPLVQQLFTNPETGAFDRTLLMGFLQNVLGADAAASPEVAQYRAFWLYLEKMIKQQRLMEKYNTLLGRAVYPNKLEVEDAYNGGKTSSDFSYAVQTYATVPDSAVSVSDRELKALYKAQMANFKQAAGRVLKYVVVDINPSSGDFAAAEEKINSFKGEFSTTTEVADLVNLNADQPYQNIYVAERDLDPEMRDFARNSRAGDVTAPFLADRAYKMYRLVGRTTAPDSVRARHIVLPLQDEAATLQRADSLLNALRGGASFEELASRFSADQQSAGQGGDLGWFTEAAAVQGIGQEFRDAVFGARGNEYFTVKSPSFVQIAQVTDRTKPVAKANVAAFVVDVEPSSQTYNEIYNRINQYIARNNTLSLFEANADSSGYLLQTDNSVAMGDNTIGAVKNARAVVQWAFNNEAGSVSKIHDVDNKFVVAAVAEVIEPGYASFDQVKSQLRSQMLERKKADKIVADLKAAAPATLEAYAREMGAFIDTARFVTFNTGRIAGIGDEPALCGVAPYVAENSVAGPVAGKNGVYVLSVFERTENEKPFDAAAERQRLEATRGYSLVYQMMDALRQNAEIEDFRFKFF